jgi:hypothetical protein
MSKPSPADWYAPAPKGSPDKYATTKPVRFVWIDPPDWAWEMAKEQVQDNDGMIRRCDTAPRRCIEVLIRAGFFFAVSVAPDFEAAMNGACPHDWIYAAIAKIALAWQVPMKDVAHLANRFFLAQLTASKFRLKYTYYYATELFGYAYNRIRAARRER